MKSPTSVSGTPTLIQNFGDEDMGKKSTEVTESSPDRFGILGLFKTNPSATSLAIGTDMTTLGLELNSTESIFPSFRSPWSYGSSKADPEFSVPKCYYNKKPPPLNEELFKKSPIETLFYAFYSMPKDVAQLYAANELFNRGWLYHKEKKFWFIRMGEPRVKANAYERGSYHCFDPYSFKMVQKDNYLLHYEMLEKRPTLPHHRV